MRRALIHICALGAVLLSPVVAQAQLKLATNNGAITITGYMGNPIVVDIPATTNGMPVTSIADNAFLNRFTLAKVTIPYNVTNIGNSAFSQSQHGSPSSLTNVIISDSVISIGNSAFSSCTSLSNLVIGTNVITIGSSAFFNTGLTNIIIPDSVIGIGASACSSSKLISASIGNGVTNIADQAFAGCTNLTNVKIGTNVTSIGVAAFQSCRSLNNFILPTNVTSIGGSGFAGCRSLTSFYIHSGLTNIGSGAFGSCAYMTEIIVDPLNPFFSSVDGVFFDKSQAIIIQCPCGKTGTYTIPSSVITLSNAPFYTCTSLTNVIIPNSISSIGRYAFGQCVSLTGVTIPNSVTSIESYAFYGCVSLRSITIPGSVTFIDTSAFDLCYSLSSFYFLGNAPNAEGISYNSVHGTVYYLPGTLGWASTFELMPTAVWLPQVQTTDAGFGVQNNQFGFNINWTSGQTVVVEACTDLTDPIWTPVATNTLSGSAGYFSDPQWTNYPGRYYRLRSP